MEDIPARENHAWHHFSKLDCLLKPGFKVGKITSGITVTTLAVAVTRKARGWITVQTLAGLWGGPKGRFPGKQSVEGKLQKLQSRTNETWWRFTTCFVFFFLHLLCLWHLFTAMKTFSLLWPPQIHAGVSTESPTGARFQVTNSGDHSNKASSH